MFFSRHQMLLSYENNVPSIVNEFDISVTYNSFFPSLLQRHWTSLNDSLMVKRKQSSDEFLLFFLHFKFM